MQFHNPYHFIPVKPGSISAVSRADFVAGARPELSHARYAPGTHSGRMLIRLRTVSPTVVGARRAPRTGQPALVEPFRLQGSPAVPASSLRGLVTSLAEAASNSSLRVLGDKPFSVRRTLEPGQALSAIGMVRVTREGDCEHHWLIPLVMPTLEAGRDGDASLPKEYRHLFPKPALKMYVGDRWTIQDEQRFGYRTFRWSRSDYYCAQLEDREWVQPGYRLPPDRYQHRRGRFVLAQKPIDGQDPKPTREITEAESAYYTPGTMRVLGGWGDRKNEIPPTRKHELFLPFDPEAEPLIAVPIPPEVVDRFHALADERTEASRAAHERGEGPLLPFEPKDTERNPKAGEPKFRLKDGDLVYFRVDRDSEQISEISLSALWRRRVTDERGKPASPREFFAAVDPELAPMHPGRRTVSIAERVFGFVEESKPEDAESALALASRVRFSNACLAPGADAGTAFLEEVTLRILSSPKPPSPSLYFRPARGEGWIAKKDLTAGRHLPQGRKHYLHHPPGGVAEPWRTANSAEHANQKSTVTPLRPGLDFYFHVDFDNLTDEEFGLLQYALCPGEEFHHKLGMGKSLGLGSVRLEPVAWFPVDRAGRYTAAGLLEKRYGEAKLAPGVVTAEWPEPYRAELSRSRETTEAEFFEPRERFRTRIDRDIKAAIRLLGKLDGAVHPVGAPLVEGQEEESETFQWFVANDQTLKDSQRRRQIRQQRQYLKPLRAGDDGLPSLERPRWERMPDR